jgi:hypothetical protein
MPFNKYNPTAFANRNDVRSRQAAFSAKPKCHALFDDGRTYCMRAHDDAEAHSLVVDHIKRNKMFAGIEYTIEKGWPNG